MRAQSFEYFSPEAVQMVMDKYAEDLAAMRSGTPYILLDLRDPDTRDRIRMMRLELSEREISDTYAIDIDVLRMILRESH